MFSNISVLTGIIFDVMLLVKIIINLLFSVFSIFNKLFFTNPVKLYSFKFEHFGEHFSSDFIF